MTSDASTNWPRHIWHDCAIHGCIGVGDDGGHCYACDGGLSGCVVCHAWEGDIVDPDRCIGVNPNTLAGIDRALTYHYHVAPVLRPAKADDLWVNKAVVVWDFGAWQYPGEVVAQEEGRFRVRTLYDGDKEPALLALEWEPGVPALAVYDPYNAVKD